MGSLATRKVAGALVLGFGLLGGIGNAAAAPHANAPTWVATKGKTVNLTLVAAYNSSAAGFNFNGAAKGAMTITVPLGDTVNVTFSNNASLPHSAQIVAGKTPPAGTAADAFKNAHTANPTAGVTKGKTQKFSFVANKAGTYLVICAVPGHAIAGMWDNFVVSKSAKSAAVAIK